MTNARVEITTQVRSTDAPKDFVTNSLYFQTAATPGLTDWQALTDHVKAVHFSNVGFGSAYPWTDFAGRGGKVVAYDMADPKPRPEKAVTIVTPTSWETGAMSMPRSVAICLSYYSDRNLKNQRGRIYLGPFVSGAETVSSALRTAVLDYGKGLFQIATLGSISWGHVVHSEKLNTYLAVSDYWVNDVYDIQRSRLSKELTRSTLHY